jgi:hypothetical protein
MMLGLPRVAERQMPAFALVSPVSAATSRRLRASLVKGLCTATWTQIGLFLPVTMPIRSGSALFAAPIRIIDLHVVPEPTGGVALAHDLIGACLMSQAVSASRRDRNL